MPFAHYLSARSTFGNDWNNRMPTTTLAGEGHRYFDLKRWELLEKYTAGVIEKSIVGDNLLTRNFQERHALWPIPAQEIEVNSALTQNPGW